LSASVSWHDRSAVRLVKVIELTANLSAAIPEKPPALVIENQNVAPPGSALEQIKEMMDDEKATHELVERCRFIDGSASDEEIRYF
jgi:hypothetical protein